MIISIISYISLLFFTIIVILLIIFISIKYNRIKKIKNNKSWYINDFNIPKNIYLSYKTKDIPEYIIKNWIALNPDYNVILYDNIDCIEFLLKYFGQEYVDIFNYIKDGPIKCDFWRICILYQFGGVYCDIDVEPLVSINSIINMATVPVSFITCTGRSYLTLNVNPHLIITIPNHHLLKKCIDVYLDLYRTKKTYEYWKWSIVTIMNNIFFFDIFNTLYLTDKEYIGNDNNRYMFIKEANNIFLELSEIYCSYNNTRILNNRYKIYDPHKHTFN